MKKLILICAILFIGTGAAVKSQSLEFTLRNLDGQLVESHDYIGKGPVLLDFWATWCKPCLKNLPKLQKVYEEYEKKGLVILAINEDGTRSLSKVEPLVRAFGLTFPVLIDQDRDVMKMYNVNGLPTTIFLDENENIVLTLRGYRPGDVQELKQHLEAMLGGDSK